MIRNDSISTIQHSTIILATELSLCIIYLNQYPLSVVFDTLIVLLWVVHMASLVL